TLPLDLWWQRAYGLGAGLWPPPQILKTVAFFGILFAGMLLGLVRQNAATSAEDEGRNLRSLKRLDSLSVAWFSGVMVALCALILIMTNYPNRQHTAYFY